MYQLHIGIPAPVARNPGRPPVKYPFGEMVVGASFFIPVTDEDPEKKITERLRTNAARYKKDSDRKSLKFRVAPYTDEVTQEKFVGLWRME